MDGLVCDGCGEGLLLADDVRYVLRIEGFAAYDPMEITRADLDKDFEEEMRRVLERLSKLDPEKAQDQVHRAFHFDLCPRCWSRFLKDPLAGAKRPGAQQPGAQHPGAQHPGATEPGPEGPMPGDKKKSQGD